MCCTCIECVGDLPEPYTVQNDDGSWCVEYKGEKITDSYPDEDTAWNKFNDPLRG